MLDKIKGIQVAQLPLKDLYLLADLIYFEGPLLSYFKDDAGQDYLYYWCDTDGKLNRWLILQPQGEQLQSFLTRQITLHTLFINASRMPTFLVDLDGEQNYQQILQVALGDLPHDYLPEPETLYDASLSIFHDDEAVRNLLMTMHSSLQEMQSKLHQIEQIVVPASAVEDEALAVA